LAQNEQLEFAYQEISNQKEIIEKSHQQITDSIRYAKQIQNAVLPQKEYINKLLPLNFILYLPRDVVSGDFYFIKKINNYIVIAAADCTGHGVPGAFMSMLSVAILNEIVRNNELNTTSKILNELRKQIKFSLQQTGQKGETQDGMDIALCAINTNTNILNFSGAYNSCWIFRKEDSTYRFFELVADRQPVGIFIKEQEFTEHSFLLEKDDTFYIFSDGYYSQFGGTKDEKFKSKRLKETLNNIQNYSMPEQKNILQQTLDNWKGDTKQVDDILIIGVKF